MDPSGSGAPWGRGTDPARDGPRAERSADRRAGAAETRVRTGRRGGPDGG